MGICDLQILVMHHQQRTYVLKSNWRIISGYLKSFSYGLGVSLDSKKREAVALLYYNHHHHHLLLCYFHQVCRFVVIHNFWMNVKANLSITFCSVWLRATIFSLSITHCYFLIIFHSPSSYSSKEDCWANKPRMIAHLLVVVLAFSAQQWLSLSQSTQCMYVSLSQWYVRQFLLTTPYTYTNVAMQ